MHAERSLWKRFGGLFKSAGTICMILVFIGVWGFTHPQSKPSAAPQAQEVQDQGLIPEDVDDYCQQKDICEQGILFNVDRDTVQFRAEREYLKFLPPKEEDCPLFSGVPDSLAVRYSDGKTVQMLTDHSQTFIGCTVQFMK